MMNIVVVGAGDVGRYIASLLSKEQHNIVLIDKDNQTLEEAALSMDIATRQGSGTDWQLLDDLLEISPDLLIAVTNKDETNLASCAIAKQLGYPRTVARVRDNRYLNRTRLDFGRIFHVDHFVSPELSVAHDILKHILCLASLAVENFAHGAVQMRTLAIPPSWRKTDSAISHLNIPPGLIVGVIRRESALIFPHGSDHLLPGDEVTFIGETEDVSKAHNYLGITQKLARSVVIVGGTLTAINLAKLLEKRDVQARLIEKDYDTCCKLSDLLPNSEIIHNDATDFTVIQSEKVGQADVVVACTSSDEVNLMVGLLAKRAGCQDVVALLSNPSYNPLAAQLGLSLTASPRVSAAKQVLSQVLSGKINSLVSLYENQAEILEIKVSMQSHVVGIPLYELGPQLPKDLLIAMIQNRGRIMVAHGNRIISPGDTVVVITNPRHVEELERIF